MTPPSQNTSMRRQYVVFVYVEFVYVVFLNQRLPLLQCGTVHTLHSLEDLRVLLVATKALHLHYVSYPVHAHMLSRTGSQAMLTITQSAG